MCLFVCLRRLKRQRCSALFWRFSPTSSERNQIETSRQMLRSGGGRAVLRRLVVAPLATTTTTTTTTTTSTTNYYVSSSHHYHSSARRGHNPSSVYFNNGAGGELKVEPSTTSDVVDAFYSKITVVDQMQNDDKVAFDVVELGLLKPYSGAFDRTAFFRGEITTVREFVRYFFFPSGCCVVRLLRRLLLRVCVLRCCARIERLSLLTDIVLLLLLPFCLLLLLLLGVFKNRSSVSKTTRSCEKR